MNGTARKSRLRILGGLWLISSLWATASGQTTDKRFYGGLQLMKGVGRSNGISYGVGVSGRFQYPLTPRVALTAKLGLEMYRITGLFLVPTTYLGYGYNGITGFGFNTIYNTSYLYPTRETGYNVPITFGPRVYLTRQVHVDLNVGVDIAANESMVSVLHLEPGVGYTLPLPHNGGVLDLTAGYFTSLARGSGVFAIGAAYGLKLSR